MKHFEHLMIKGVLSRKEYEALKANVIDIFNSYESKIGNIDRNYTPDGIDIGFLKKRIESLEKNKFLLAVVGEVKAGKSTLINALIGEEILPNDILQSTSAIVEIFKSETPFLKIKYANGSIETIYDNPQTPDINEVKEELRKICQIPDEYRDIPVVIIQQDIILWHRGKDSERIEEGDQLPVNEQYIKYLEERSHLNNLNDKKHILEKYISETTIDKIPQEIMLGYPIKLEFNELHIVDTPGVNAIGGVQDISFKFIENADAILFVHPIKPIESQSLKRFVESVITKRSKEMLFLVLTHAGNYSNDEVERLYTEAKTLYKNLIPESHILVVDSLLKIIHNELEKGVPLEKIRQDKKKKKILASFIEQSREENRELIDLIYEASRFKDLEARLYEFSVRSPILLMKYILDKIKEGYEKMESYCTEKITMLEMKKRHPQEFAEEINRIQKALEEYRLLKNYTVENLRAKYSGRHSKWYKEVEEVKERYLHLITESKDRENIRKHFFDGISYLQNTCDRFIKELTQELHEIFKKIGQDFKEKHHITVPSVDWDALEARSKENTYIPIEEKRKWDIWDIITLGIARLFRENTIRRIEYSEKKHLDNLKYECKKELVEKSEKLSNELQSLFDNNLDNLSNEIDSTIKNRIEMLEKLKNEEQYNEQIIQEIGKLEIKKNDIIKERLRCKEVLENI